MNHERLVKTAAFFDELTKLAADAPAPAVPAKLKASIGRKSLYPLLLAPALIPALGLWVMANLMKSTQPGVYSPALRIARYHPGRASDYKVPVVPKPMGRARGGYGGPPMEMYDGYGWGGGGYGGGGGGGGALSSVQGAVSAAKGAI